ncbi:MAG: hypothetical protein ACYCPR_06520 [Thermoplasmataceae archaeon]
MKLSGHQRGSSSHAGLNGVYNIIKKAILKVSTYGIEGIWLFPRSLKYGVDDNFERWVLKWLIEIIT